MPLSSASGNSKLALPLLLIATVATATLATAASGFPPQDIQLCYLNFIRVDDLGYSFSFNVARLKIHQNIQATFPNSTVQSHIEDGLLFMSPEEKRAVLRDFVQRGCHVVATNYEFALHDGNYSEVSALYPNVTFISTTQPDRELFNTALPNFLFMMQVPREAFYIKGAAAAAEARNCIGLIAAWEDRTNANDAINGALLGIRDENPNLPVHLVTMDSWHSPGPEADAARVLLHELGCSVIMRYTDPRDVDIVVQREGPRGAFSIGPHSDLQRYVGDSVLVASYVSWDIGLTPMIAQVLRTGRPDFSGVPYAFGGDVVLTTDLSPRASPAAVAAFQRAQTRVAGRPGIYCGPITLRNGTVVQTDPGACRGLAQSLDKFIQTPGLTYHGVFRYRGECGPGQFAVYRTAPNISLSCVPCPANTYSAEAGQLACTPCANGTVSTPGSSSCVVETAAPRSTPAWLIIVIVMLLVLVVAGTLAGAAVARRASKANHDNAPKSAPLCLLFTDIESSTDLWQSYPKDMAAAVDTHHRVIRGVIGEYAGYEVKTVGDAFMIATSSVVDGTMVAVQIQRALQEAEWPETLKYQCESQPQTSSDVVGLKVRIGVHWCEEVEPKYEAERDYWDYYGNDVNIAARAESKARGGQVLLSHAAFRALKADEMFSIVVEPQITHSIFAQGVELKGVAEPVTLYSVLPVELSGRTFEPLEGYSTPVEGPLRTTSTVSSSHDASGVVALSLGNILVVTQRLISRCPPADRAKVVRTLAAAWDPASKDRPVAHALRSVATAAALSATGPTSNTPSAQQTPHTLGSVQTPRVTAGHPNEMSDSN